ncbi:hypothetical protein [Oceanirhabdus sp. W0125-5]|uniref:hypothetical protein n=1 Tax=Oceanirhabdus sp. W0125-5 TaxID=2999116 RepID=UPI0022F2BBF7|nr:hypothetical protein [Oceanirhabdus sp. W0125-5]WBW98324.1 hypothetical protein OW730_06020 [Oceanirhabdus sp. W0125-5]
MADGIIKGKRWEITRAQREYMEKYDEQTCKSYYRLRRNNEKIRTSRKVISVIFVVSIIIILCYIKFGIMGGTLIPSSDKLDIAINKAVSMTGISCAIYLGVLCYGILVTNINNKKIFKIAQEYGTVDENK